MERPVYQPLGTPIDQLDTPALVVDLATMERNIETLHSFFRGAAAKVRPHVTAHKCPAIAHRQLAAGGAVGGIAVSRMGEAEVFAEAGFGDILVSSQIVTRGKIIRLCALSRMARVSVAVDNPKNVRDLSQAAQASGSTLRVLVDISTGPESAGVAPGRPAVELAKLVARSPGLEFAGLMTSESVTLRDNHESNGGGPASVVQSVLDTREMAEMAGLEVGTVCTGGLLNYQQAAAAAGVTEVPVGSYPLLDHNWCQQLSQFQPAARVVTTVVSRPTESYAIADAGHKAMAPDLGVPVLDGVPGARVTRLSAEHASVELEGAARKRVKVGDKLQLIPRDLDPCLNQYDFIHAVRDGKLEAVWRISARGRSD